MGCDIHPAIEVMDRGGDRWLLLAKGGLGTFRCYATFYALAGVRNFDVEPVCEPRGVPEDISLRLRDCLEDYALGDHTHSWLTLPEVEEAHRRVLAHFKSDDGLTGLEIVIATMKAVEAQGHKARFVFGFYS